MISNQKAMPNLTGTVVASALLHGNCTWTRMCKLCGIHLYKRYLALRVEAEINSHIQKQKQLFTTEQNKTPNCTPTIFWYLCGNFARFLMFCKNWNLESGYWKKVGYGLPKSCVFLKFGCRKMIALRKKATWTSQLSLFQ